MEEDRLIAIQEDVHGIRGSIKALHERIDRTDTKIGQLERDIITVTAEQHASDKILTNELSGVKATLIDHTAREDKDRRVLMALGWVTLFAVLGALGTMLLDHVATRV